MIFYLIKISNNKMLSVFINHDGKWPKAALNRRQKSVYNTGALSKVLIQISFRQGTTIGISKRMGFRGGYKFGINSNHKNQNNKYIENTCAD